MFIIFVEIRKIIQALTELDKINLSKQLEEKFTLFDNGLLRTKVVIKHWTIYAYIFSCNQRNNPKPQLIKENKTFTTILRKFKTL